MKVEKGESVKGEGKEKRNKKEKVSCYSGGRVKKGGECKGRRKRKERSRGSVMLAAGGRGSLRLGRGDGVVFLTDIEMERDEL